MFIAQLDKYRDFGILIMRIGLGIMFMYHGFPKISGGVETWIKVGTAMKFLGITSFPALWGFMAAATEFFGGAMLAMGLLSRMTSCFLAFTMVVATMFKFGSGAGFAGAAPAIEMLVIFLGLILIGPGRYSLDSYWHK